MTSTWSVITRRWSGLHRIKLGVDWQSAPAVVRGTSHSSITFATIAPCEWIALNHRTLANCQNPLRLMKIYGNDLSLVHPFKVVSIKLIVCLQYCTHFNDSFNFVTAVIASNNWGRRTNEAGPAPAVNIRVIQGKFGEWFNFDEKNQKKKSHMFWENSSENDLEKILDHFLSNFEVSKVNLLTLN